MCINSNLILAYNISNKTDGKGILDLSCSECERDSWNLAIYYDILYIDNYEIKQFIE